MDFRDSLNGLGNPGNIWFHRFAVTYALGSEFLFHGVIQRYITALTFFLEISEISVRYKQNYIFNALKCL